MNLQSLIVVILRLMALNFFIQVAIQLAPQLVRFTDASQSGGGMRELGSYMVVPLLMVIGLIAGAILIWVFALSIAAFVTRGVQRDLSFGAMSLVDCYSIAFVGIGLFYVTRHFPQVLNWAHFMFVSAASDSGSSSRQGVSGYDISQAIVPFILGVVMFVKGRAWAVALARLQEKAESANQTLHATAAPPGS